MRRMLCIVLATLLAFIASPASALTYASVTLTVPVTVDQMPLGTTAKVTCRAPRTGAISPGDPVEEESTPIPVTQAGGFVLYHGGPLKIVMKNPAALTSGVYIGCRIDWSPGSPTDPAKSKYETFSVQLK